MRRLSRIHLWFVAICVGAFVPSARAETMARLGDMHAQDRLATAENAVGQGKFIGAWESA